MAKGKTSSAPKAKFYVLVGHNGTVLPLTALCVAHLTKTNYLPLQRRFDLSQWAQVSEGTCIICPDDETGV